MPPATPPSNAISRVTPRALLAACGLAVPLFFSAIESNVSQAQIPPNAFVTRRGDQLIDGDKPFRFISFNIPNLQLVEDNFAPDAKTAWRWPDQFELNDALASVAQLGGTVVRTYVLSVKREGSDMGDHVYVRGPGDFNEEAFRTLDLALETAGKHGVRVIIPLVDNWKWQGGRGEYAAFRGKQPDDFWTDEQIIADFEQTIRHVLTRVNTRTGVAYRDDPTILAWETGNELDGPPQWTRRIARFIKSLDGKHLVLDGGSWRRVEPKLLDDPNIDVVATHHYPNLDSASYVPAILAAKEATRGKRPYLVGEFGFASPDEFERVYDAVIDNDVSGALLWSLRFHNRDGGFYWHWEPAGAGLFKAYHWPGFPSGDAYQERRVLELTRDRAFKIRGLPLPLAEPPQAPTLLPINDVAQISWQGAAGANSYSVERAPAVDGPWATVAERVDDAAVAYRPLFHDDSARPGDAPYYRVLAHNAAGASPPSNVVGPVPVVHRTLVDECRDLAVLSVSAGDVQVAFGDNRRRHEDLHRISLAPGSAITYEVADPILGWRAILYSDSPDMKLVASYSVDGRSFEPAAADRQTAPQAKGDYNYLHKNTMSSSHAPSGARFLRLEVPQQAPASVELSTLEVRYGREKIGSVRPQ